MARYLSLALIIFFISCKENTTKVTTESEVVATNSTNTYTESFRPQFHFSPPTHWMNDPNGLVYHQGVYHLFYQYYPEDIVWGPMHWGHAVSKDMITWEHKPIALYPDDLGLIFSGSAVVDVTNSSGFGTLENPPLVAIFTYHLMAGEKAGRKDFQTQGIAYSLDNGDTWVKYEGNPVIGNKDIKDFRDPKVFWHEDSEQWILTLVAGDHAKFYSSSNLKEWKLISEFGKDKGDHGGVWECPDLFKLKVEGTDEEKWVLLVSINPGAPNGGSGTQYFVGEFDGTTFTTQQTETKWIDLGRDNYAGVTYNNTPNNERIFIGWMSNWDYARTTPTEVWRSAMTLPRTISLHKDETGYFIKNYPLEELSTISSEAYVQETFIGSQFELSNQNFNASEISFKINLVETFELTFSNSLDEKIVFKMLPARGELHFNRTQSGHTDFDEKFAPGIQKQVYNVENEYVEIRMILDASSIEIFVDGGRYVFTNQIFPQSPYTNLSIRSWSNTMSIRDFKMNKLTSIWNNE